MINFFRKILRQKIWWIQIQEARREGLLNFLKRKSIQSKILKTAPIPTELDHNEVEVHCLTWRKDYLNIIWSLKTFYKFLDVKYPLVIHDGGLLQYQIKILQDHFPNARIIKRSDSDTEITKYLEKHNYSKSVAYRKSNVATLKVFDYFYYSRAKRIVHVDSDIVFFNRPQEFISAIKQGKNVYNKDFQFAYSISIEEAQKLAGCTVPVNINSGLFVLDRDALDLSFIESCLVRSKKLYENKWVTEQTIHALCAARKGVSLLSDNYLISIEKGLETSTVCKHYTGFFKPYFYQEGLKKIVSDKVLDFL